MKNTAPTHTALIPRPVSVQPLEGRCRIHLPRMQVAAEPSARGVASWFMRQWNLPWNHLVPIDDLRRSAKSPSLVLRIDPHSSGNPEGEGYQLSVDADQVEIKGDGLPGVFYGLISWMQLIDGTTNSPPPAEIVDSSCVTIQDAPRFRWRGLMLDVSRHYMPVPFIKKLLDLMAFHKLNMFHWHLTDDQGWRLQSLRFPELTEKGSVRASSPKPGYPDEQDGVPYGPFYYTPDEIHDIVAYAANRQITVVPEIDMPGHVRALLAARPELGCTGGPYSVGTRWGVEEDVLCPGREEVFTFVEEVLDEVFDLFPGPYLHLGGDEVPTTRWKACQECRQRMNAEGIQSADQLQEYFLRRVEKFVTKRNRKVIGWDETLEKGCPDSVTIMSWRGERGGRDAVKAGRQAIMTPHTHCYFDYAESQEPWEPEAIGSEITPLEKTYAYDPMPEGLTLEEAARILGVQWNVWTEYMWTEEDIEYKVFPRACALAERAWSSPDIPVFDFMRRLNPHLERLNRLGICYRTPEEAYSNAPVSS